MCRICLYERTQYDYFIAEREVDGITEYAPAIELTFLMSKRKQTIGLEYCNFTHQWLVGIPSSAPYAFLKWTTDKEMVRQAIDATIEVIKSGIERDEQKHRLNNQRKHAKVKFTKYP